MKDFGGGGMGYEKKTKTKTKKHYSMSAALAASSAKKSKNDKFKITYLETYCPKFNNFKNFFFLLGLHKRNTILKAL